MGMTGFAACEYNADPVACASFGVAEWDANSRGQ